MRAFLGVPITQKIREKISKIQENFDIKGTKLVKPRNLHWTVKFFGEIDNKERGKIEKRLEKIDHRPFRIKVEGLGVFPSISYIKVIWAGCKEGKKFKEFIEQVKDRFKDIGKKDNHEVVPHLTMGRVKFVKDKEKLIKLIKERESIEIGEMEVNKLVLYKSELTPKEPIYEKIKEVELNG